MVASLENKPMKTKKREGNFERNFSLLYLYDIINARWYIIVRRQQTVTKQKHTPMFAQQLITSLLPDLILPNRNLSRLPAATCSITAALYFHILSYDDLNRLQVS